MAALEYDEREFTATFFALRLGLIFSALLVVLAPVVLRIVQGNLPPTISDSWWTDARTIFVVGLTAASCLLVVVRGDTLTEQTLLNIAGALGFIVASVACVPKDVNGKPLAVYDADVAQLNKFALLGLLTIAFLVWAVGTRLPTGMRGTGWIVTGWPRRILTGALPSLLVVGAAVFPFADDALSKRAHGPAAIVMFILLGSVAMLRTAWGVRILERMGDTPVDRSLTSERVAGDREEVAPLKRFDAIYWTVAMSMFLVVGIAIVLFFALENASWVLFVEAALLILFVIFWSVQTREAWLEMERRSNQRG